MTLMRVPGKSRLGGILNLTSKPILGKGILKLESLGQKLLRGGTLRAHCTQDQKEREAVTR